MLKSGLKLSAAGLIGGMLSLSFLYFFPINDNHNTTAVTSSKEITEKIENTVFGHKNGSKFKKYIIFENFGG